MAALRLIMEEEKDFTPLVRDGKLVPWVTRWSGEVDRWRPDLHLNRARQRLSYDDEGPEDRDDHGVLCERTAGWYGAGHPEWSKICPLRHRAAMRLLLCQVCARPASCTDEGVLFLEPGKRSAETLEGAATGQPPLCLTHAVAATEQCPRLRHWTAYRAQKYPLWGALGTLFKISGGQLVETGDPQNVAYGHALAPRLLVHQIKREVRHITLVDLDEEVACARESGPEETCAVRRGAQ